MSYRIVETDGNETLAEIAAREGIPYSLGTGFYQLKKKESISGEKKLILWNGTEFDDVNARKTLDIRGEKVDLRPNQVPSGQVLFVNSTSANRKVQAGKVIFKVKDEKRGEKVPSKTAKRKQADEEKVVEKPLKKKNDGASRKTKKRRGDDDEDDQDEDEPDVSEDVEEINGFVNWKVLMTKDPELEDEWDKNVVPRLSNAIVVDDDEGATPVPQKHLQPILNNLIRTMHEFPSWTQTEKRIWDDAEFRYQWTAKNNAARLMHLRTADQLVFALEVPQWEFGLVVGANDYQPLIRARTLSFDFTDTNCSMSFFDERVPQACVSAEFVLSCMMRDLVMTAFIVT